MTSQLAAVSSPTVGQSAAASWADAVASNETILAGATLGRKNALMNAVGFPVNQRGATSLSAAGYFCDRWLYTPGTGATESLTYQSGPAANGFTPNCVLWQRSVVGSTPSIFEQRIESVYWFPGQTLTVTLYGSAVFSGVDVIPVVVQHFGTGGSADVTTTGPTITVSQTGVFTSTIVLPSLSGKSFGTAGTDYVSIQLQRPTTGTGPTDSLTLYGVQVEIGTGFTGMEWPSIAETLSMCQRFYWRVTGNASTATLIGSGLATATTTGSYYVKLPQTMRALPSLGASGVTALSLTNGTGTLVAGSATPVLTNGNGDSVQINGTVAAGLTAGQPSLLYVPASSAAWVDFTAEL